MRLVTFTPRAGDGREIGDGRGTTRVGALVEDGVLDLSDALGVADLTELLRRDLLGAARDVVARGGGSVRSREAVRLEPPVRPRAVLCIGYNYRGHTGDVPDPEFPDVFVKTPNTVIGPEDRLLLPPESQCVDYEAEVAVVIGRSCRAVTPETALDHVAGYTIFDDVSARDWQGRTSQWTLGKSFDTFGPLGPALVTPDELGDPQVLDVELRHNGRLTVSSSTARMIFTMADLVSYVSQAITLEPGDVIATGTPQKLPEALAAPAPLADGDVVEISITGLGTLRTAVTAAPDPRGSGAPR
ncbi:fumarylacetoacetate hydrolase family protein [Salana multivorans]|uniref:fumarylacetoacetate hydrolase family protein n=1 Tax=Salana multivorans TaxID=120377 RepID=UPI000A58D97C|nr:fumarylacetoacetate hydrolase family protein [Salana multivorans]